MRSTPVSAIKKQFVRTNSKERSASSARATPTIKLVLGNQARRGSDPPQTPSTPVPRLEGLQNVQKRRPPEEVQLQSDSESQSSVESPSQTKRFGPHRTTSGANDLDWELTRANADCEQHKAALAMQLTLNSLPSVDSNHSSFENDLTKPSRPLPQRPSADARLEDLLAHSHDMRNRLAEESPELWEPLAVTEAKERLSRLLARVVSVSKLGLEPTAGVFRLEDVIDNPEDVIRFREWLAMEARREQFELQHPDHVVDLMLPADLSDAMLDRSVSQAFVMNQPFNPDLSPAQQFTLKTFIPPLKQNPTPPPDPQRPNTPPAATTGAHNDDELRQPIPTNTPQHHRTPTAEALAAATAAEEAALAAADEAAAAAKAAEATTTTAGVANKESSKSDVASDAVEMSNGDRSDPGETDQFVVTIEHPTDNDKLDDNQGMFGMEQRAKSIEQMVNSFRPHSMEQHQLVSSFRKSVAQIRRESHRGQTNWNQLEQQLLKVERFVHLAKIPRSMVTSVQHSLAPLTETAVLEVDEHTNDMQVRIQQTLVALQTDMHEPELVYQDLKQLLVLANSNLDLVATASDAIATVLHALRRHSTVEKLLHAGCVVLSRCLESIDLREDFTRAGGVKVLLESMENNRISLKVQYQAIHALVVACEDGTVRQQVLENQGFPSILRSMQVHSSSAQVQHVACWAISFLTSHDTALRDEWGKLGAGTFVLSALHKHKFAEDLHYQGLRALVNLTVVQEVCQQLTDDGVCVVVSESMMSHPESTLIQGTGCWVLAHLSMLAAARKSMLEVGIITTVVLHVMTNHKVKTVQRCACWLVSNLCVEKEARNQTGVPGALLMCKALVLYPEDTDICEYVVRAFSYLTRSKQLLDAGTIAQVKNVVERALEMHSSSEDLKFFAEATLRNIQSPEN